MLTLAEDLVLLALDDQSGRILPVDDIGYRHALGGAVLMDLALRGKIDNDVATLRLVDETPSAEGLLNHWISIIAAESESLPAKVWIARLALESEEIEHAALSRLVERGILACQEKRLLWVFETRRYPTIDGTEEREVKRRIIDVLLSDGTPSQTDAILVGLVDDARLLPHLLSEAETRNAATRVVQVRELDRMGQEVSAVIEHLRIEMLQALTRAPQ
ncbi:MAG: GPP34 family phosphoprotein [Deltaproteobacteria bacterium]